MTANGYRVSLWVMKLLIDRGFLLGDENVLKLVSGGNSLAVQ